MPGFDGTGPRGAGPFSGGGRGFCALVLPPPDTGETPYGFAGAQGATVRYAPLAAPAPPPAPVAGAVWRCFGRRRGCGRRGRW